MNSFHSLKGGSQKVLPGLEGGSQKVSDSRFFHFVALLLPVINDQSLTRILIVQYRSRYLSAC